MEYISADHIAAVGGNGAFEPQRTNNFTVRFSPPQNIRAGGRGGVAAQDIIALSVDSCPFPESTADVIEVPFGNEVRKVSGRWKFSNETLVVKDYVGAEVSDIIDAWARLVYDPNPGPTAGRIGYAHEYKVNGELLFFGPDGQQIRRWKLIGMWPMRVKPGQGDMNQGNTQNKMEIEFCVDKAVYAGRG